MKNLSPIIRFTIVTSVSLILATFASWFHYRSYWRGTIRRVQTVDFNILSHSLPTKLSYALINNNVEEIQRTLDSNYGLFGLVVTDCQTREPICPHETILFTSNSPYQWKQELSPELLHQSSYSSLQDPPPLYAEGTFNSPHDETWQMTNRENSGQIIGRVYYVRGIPPKFNEDIIKWSSQLPPSLFSDSGTDKYYSLTFFLFFLGGCFTFVVLESILLRKRINEERAREKELKLQEELDKISASKLKLEQRFTESEKKIQVQEEQQKELITMIGDLEQKNEQQKQEKSIFLQKLQTLHESLRDESLRDTEDQSQSELQEKEREIIELQNNLSQYETEIEENQQRITIATQDLENARQSEQIARKESEQLRDSMSQLEQIRQELETNNNTLSDEFNWRNHLLEEYEQENQRLNQENENLEQENHNLQTQLSSLENNNNLRFAQKNRLQDESRLISFKLTESDFYSLERKELILDILKKNIDNVHSNSRRDHILQDIVNNNASTGTREALKTEIHSLFRDYRRMNPEIRNALERMGFEIISEKNHYKIRFRQDNRYVVTISCTASDHRAGRNIVRDISNLLL